MSLARTLSLPELRTCSESAPELSGRDDMPKHEFDGLPPIKVIGVGGGGCNAVNRMAAGEDPRR